MSGADSIYRAVRKVGRSMVLRRLATPSNIDVTVYGTTSVFQPEELVGALVQGGTKVSITNREIAAASWPGPPKKGDRMVIDGKPKSIEGVEPKYLGSEVAAFVMAVSG